jgi:hypothetical protein
MNQVVLTILMSKAKLFKAIKYMVEGKTLGHDETMVEFFVRFLHVNGVNYTKMVFDFLIKGRFSWGVNQIFIMLLFKGPMIRCLGVFCLQLWKT